MKLSSRVMFDFRLENMEGKLNDFFFPYQKYLETLLKKSWGWSWVLLVQREIVASTKIVILKSYYFSLPSVASTNKLCV